ncbi:MAG: hypothetical protein GWN84_11105 [Gammaproteobacteria bacterium]|nr:hypothetical protein [Gammaproteobacteria bacterium]NIR83412.1 hypothetical protein [Gammaproteobacteria bacterium]NIR91334.1 hypothetical protein [Gammaproteobacteria bacterium]NIU04574.1 hypothetical protein [Gammaproteobacteria bacterium]NIV51616.1 hypothetical protein [Gammaproteobacteria bacterium]
MIRDHQALLERTRVLAERYLTGLSERPVAPPVDVSALREALGGARPAREAWLHVDGAFGLRAAASPTLRPHARGMERADSWATDGHKWLNLPYETLRGISGHAHMGERAEGCAESRLRGTRGMCRAVTSHRAAGPKTPAPAGWTGIGASPTPRTATIQQGSAPCALEVAGVTRGLRPSGACPGALSLQVGGHPIFREESHFFVGDLHVLRSYPFRRRARARRQMMHPG